MIRWWPAISIAAMTILGLAVGKGSTPIDRWFFSFDETPARYLLFFSHPTLLVLVMMVSAAVAFDSGRERLAAIVVLAPFISWGIVQGLKALFDRRKDGALAYPSGHITLTVVVWGLVVVVAGAALWSVITSVTVVLLAMLGQGVTWHYITDTLGAVLLGTAIVCVGALLAKLKLTRVNPVRPASHVAVNMRS